MNPYQLQDLVTDTQGILEQLQQRYEALPNAQKAIFSQLEKIAERSYKESRGGNEETLTQTRLVASLFLQEHIAGVVEHYAKILYDQQLGLVIDVIYKTEVYL